MVSYCCKYECWLCELRIQDYQAKPKKNAIEYDWKYFLRNDKLW